MRQPPTARSPAVTIYYRLRRGGLRGLTHGGPFPGTGRRPFQTECRRNEGIQVQGSATWVRLRLRNPIERPQRARMTSTSLRELTMRRSMRCLFPVAAVFVGLASPSDAYAQRVRGFIL